MYLSKDMVNFELEERRHTAERVRVQWSVPMSDRIVKAVTSGLGRLLVLAGTRLEMVADQHGTKGSLVLSKTDPCRGCAN